jgi:hypothetical protein
MYVYMCIHMYIGSSVCVLMIGACRVLRVKAANDHGWLASSFARPRKPPWLVHAAQGSLSTKHKQAVLRSILDGSCCAGGS